MKCSRCWRSRSSHQDSCYTSLHWLQVYRDTDQSAGCTLVTWNQLNHNHKLWRTESQYTNEFYWTSICVALPSQTVSLKKPFSHRSHNMLVNPSLHVYAPPFESHTLVMFATPAKLGGWHSIESGQSMSYTGNYIIITTEFTKNLVIKFNRETEIRGQAVWIRVWHNGLRETQIDRELLQYREWHVVCTGLLNIRSCYNLQITIVRLQMLAAVIYFHLLSQIWAFHCHQLDCIALLVHTLLLAPSTMNESKVLHSRLLCWVRSLDFAQMSWIGWTGWHTAGSWLLERDFSQ